MDSNAGITAGSEASVVLVDSNHNHPTGPSPTSTILRQVKVPKSEASRKRMWNQSREKFSVVRRKGQENIAKNVTKSKKKTHTAVSRKKNEQLTKGLTNNSRTRLKSSERTVLTVPTTDRSKDISIKSEGSQNATESESTVMSDEEREDKLKTDEKPEVADTRKSITRQTKDLRQTRRMQSVNILQQAQEQLVRKVEVSKSGASRKRDQSREKSVRRRARDDSDSPHTTQGPRVPHLHLVDDHIKGHPVSDNRLVPAADNNKDAKESTKHQRTTFSKTSTVAKISVKTTKNVPRPKTKAARMSDRLGRSHVVVRRKGQENIAKNVTKSNKKTTHTVIQRKKDEQLTQEQMNNSGTRLKSLEMIIRTVPTPERCKDTSIKSEGSQNAAETHRRSEVSDEESCDKLKTKNVTNSNKKTKHTAIPRKKDEQLTQEEMNKIRTRLKSSERTVITVPTTDRSKDTSIKSEGSQNATESESTVVSDEEREDKLKTDEKTEVVDTRKSITRQTKDLRQTTNMQSAAIMQVQEQIITKVGTPKYSVSHPCHKVFSYLFLYEVFTFTFQIFNKQNG